MTEDRFFDFWAERHGLDDSQQRHPEEEVEGRDEAYGEGGVGEGRVCMLSHQLGHARTCHGDKELLLAAFSCAGDEHEAEPRPEPALAEDDEGVADRAEPAEEPLGAPSPRRPQEAGAKGAVGLYSGRERRWPW